ncbi:MAG: VWA domain-containing protein, partial [Gammaproteobacteria bacterium]|nr:VWA domain-containing protein [Gammaproteobacteria bacterium]
LLSEALYALGDQFAIYGFSGSSRRNCTVYRVKDFEEPYNQATQNLIIGISPRNYTRMGVAVRHLTNKLKSREARTKLLLIVSDGQPEDKDGYRGRYAIEDTRKAIIEARSSSIYPFCITIDKRGLDYLPHMFGRYHFTVIDNVRHLPSKLSELYYQMTH